MRCFPFHDWGRWTAPLPYKQLFGDGFALKQMRSCVRCGKAKARHIEYIDQPDLSGDEIGQ